MYHSRSPVDSVTAQPLLLRLVPAFASLRGYNLASLRADFVAGVTVAAVAVPQAMAYALIAGLPAELGLYTAIVMTIVGALLASSKQLINGPTNAISIAVLSILTPITTPDTLVPTAILLTFAVGIVQLSITMLRLGDLSRYISHSVILGFTTGASALLVLDQLKNLLGVPAVGGVHDNFIERFYHTWSSTQGIHAATAWVGVGAIGLVLALRWLKARLRLPLLPELLIVVIGAAIVVGQLGLEEQGVKVVGTIPAHLPSFKVPEFDTSVFTSMAGGATALALLGLLEAISMAKALAAHTRERLDINQQFLSEAAGNLVGSFFQCIPGSGSLTRSAINQQAGAVSQWAGVFSAVAVAATMLVFAEYAQYIPRAALAGILMVTAFKMVEWKTLAYHFRASRFDAAIVLATALSAVVISIEFCVLIGVLLSFVMAVPRVGKTLLTEFVATEAGYAQERLHHDPADPRMLIFGLEGELFFAAAASLESQLGKIEDRILPETRVIILRLKRAKNPDAVGLGLLEQFIADMKLRGVTVLMCGVRQELLAVLVKCGLVERLGRDNLFVEQPVRLTSTHQAVEYGQSLLRNLEREVSTDSRPNVPESATSQRGVRKARQGEVSSV
jgi:sulfate permease, SulP family